MRKSSGDFSWYSRNRVNRQELLCVSPERFLAVLTERCPCWRFNHGEPPEPPCLINHCLRCGAKLTDSYTHAEPGSAFFPTSSDECCNISVFLLPAENDVSVLCSWSSGGLTDWLDYDQAKPWEALVPNG